MGRVRIGECLMQFVLTIMIDSQGLSQILETGQGVTVASDGTVLQTIDRPIEQNLVSLDQSALGPNGTAEVYLSQYGQQAGRPWSVTFSPEQPALTIRYDDEGSFTPA